jgi:quercetin dioxygenase-like cupin family protein
MMFGSRSIALLSLLCAGCAVAPAEGGRVRPPAPGATVTLLARSATTVTGQSLATPETPFEAVISRSQLPPGGVLPMHKHPWPRYAYVMSGRLRVSYEESGLVREFGPGEAVIEAIDQWHMGEVIGDRPVVLIVFDQVPPGRSNVVTR